MSPDWTEVRELIADVLGHGDESRFPAEGGRFEDDGDFRSSKHAAVALLEKLVKKRTARAIPDVEIAQFADLLIHTAEDERSWTEYSEQDGGSGMDPLTASLNWPRPIRLRGLIHLLAWGSESVWYDAASSALDAAIERPDAHGATYAVVGEGVGRLFDSASDWLVPRVPRLFGVGSDSTPQQQIALTTATAIYLYHPGLFELLSPSMIAAIDARGPLVSGWHTQSEPLQRIGEWAIDAIVRDDTTSDGPVARAFFATAPPETRGGAIGHMAWAFMHATEVDVPFRDRLAALWDERVEHVRSNPDDAQELNGFHWFVRSRKFAVQWWLPRLNEALELYPDLGAERFIIGKELASAADVDPRGAFDVLRLLLAHRDQHGRAAFDLARYAIPMVLARAISSGDAALKGEAESYMNQLGELGSITLEAEVNQVLSGLVTQSDVDE